MAKKNTVAELKAEIETLKAALAKSEVKRNELGAQALSMACLLREKFVKNLSAETFNSEFGVKARAFLTYIEGVKPSGHCVKCGGVGVITIGQHGDLVRCFGCIVGRIVHGKGGKMHYVDLRVHQVYESRKNSRFSQQERQDSPYALTQAEIEAYKTHVEAKKNKSAEEADLTF